MKGYSQSELPHVVIPRGRQREIHGQRKRKETFGEGGFRTPRYPGWRLPFKGHPGSCANCGVGSAEEGRLADDLLGDGRYACERFWQACDQAKCFGVVNTTDAEVFMHLQALAFMALGAYRAFLSHHRSLLPRLWDQGPIPLRLLQSIFRLVLSPADTS